MTKETKKAEWKLYQINENMAQIEEYIESAENPEEMERLMNDTIEANEEQAVEIIESLQAMERNYSAEAEKFKNEEQFFKQRKLEQQKRADKINKFVAETLAGLGYDHKNKKKIETKFGKTGFRKNPPKLEITDKSKIPMKYEIIPEPTYDTKKMLNDYKEELKYEEENEKGKAVKKQKDELDYTEEYGFRIINNSSSLSTRK